MDYPKSTPSVGLVNGRFVDENPVNGSPGSLIPAVWGNAVTSEILGVIQDAGLVPDETANTQLAQAVRKIVTDNKPGAATESESGVLKLATVSQVSTGFDDTAAVTSKKLSQRLATAVQGQSFTAFMTGGVAPSFVLSPSPAITAYVANQRFQVKFHMGGVGSDTINVSGLGAKALKQYDSSGNKVSAVIQGQLSDVVYDGADFVLLDQLPPLQSIPVGTVFTIATQTPPMGTIKANGAAVSRALYSALFSVIGVTYGAGDGSTTFNLPDLRGEFIRGWDDGRGVDVGRVFGSFQGHMFQNHTHYSTASGWVGNGGNATGGAGVAFGQSGDNTAVSGSFGAETRPRNISLLQVIKY